MSRSLNNIEYKGFTISLEKSRFDNHFYTIKGHCIVNKSYLHSVKAAQNVIDTYLKSINKTTMDSNTENSKVEQYSKLLKEHDWYYHQSDDNRIWEEGQKKHNEIVRLREEINLSHNMLGNVLYKEASPFEK